MQEKQKSKGAQAFFFEKIQFFSFCGMPGGCKFWALESVLSAGGFCGFGDFVGSKSHLRRLSNGLVSVLPMGRECRRALLPKRFLAGTDISQGGLPMASRALSAALLG